MTAFEPGEGWRLLRDVEVLNEGAEVITHSTGDDARSWVRHSAPKLASAAWTVLRLQLGPDEAVVVLDGDKYRVLPKNIWITIDDPQWPVQLLEVLATPPTPFLPHQGREQAEAWERVAAHPAVQPCHDEDRPLVDAVLALLDRYEVLDDTDQSLREAQAKETARAVLAVVRRYRKEAETWPGALNMTAHDFGVQP